MTSGLQTTTTITSVPPVLLVSEDKYPDLAQLRKYWSAIRLPGEIVELRYPTKYFNSKKQRTVGGSRNVRCSSPEELAEAIKCQGPELTYWVNLQKMKQDTPLKPYGGALTDDDIESYRWLPIDYDPKRPGKVCATSAEKENAEAGAYELYQYFRSLGVDPTIIDSGNGVYILPPVDLLNTPGNRDLVERAVNGIRTRYYRESAKVDSSAVNPSRVFGLPGTLNSKGDSTAERPHRPRLLLHAGSRDTVLSAAQLEEMASWAPRPIPSSSAPAGASDEKGPFTFENVEEFFKALEKKTVGQERCFNFEEDTSSRNSRGPGWLVRCPHDSAHSNPGEDLDGSSVAWMTFRGFPIFHCSHDGDEEMPCNQMGWREFVSEWHAEDLQERITKPWNFPDPASTAAWLEGTAKVILEPVGLSDLNEPDNTTSEESSALDKTDALLDASVVAAPFFSDIALAKKFAEAAKGRIAFLDRGVWTHYKKGQWRDDDNTSRHVRHVVSEYLLQQMTAVDKLIPKSPDPREETSRARTRRVLKTQLGSAAKESSVRSQVQHQPGMFLHADVFDKNPLLLGAPKGQVIDLKTGLTRSARPEDFLSKSVSCLPGGGCPQFLRFLSEITGADTKLQDYLQRTLGYWLTADVREQCLAVWHGPGGNGKGTLINVVQHILGDSDKSGYGCTIPMDALMAKKSGETDLRNVARMRGARLVVSQESGLQRKFDSGLLKTLTGGDELTGERKFEHPFNFFPSHKLLVVTNHRPKIDLDEGMKRRLHLVPFLQVFDQTKKNAKPPDRMLKEKLLAEAPGILAWMLRGCLDWQQRGLDPPASVTDYTSEFFADHDTLSEWLAESCDVRAEHREFNELLYSDWKIFCSNGRGDAGSHTEFVDNLRKRGFLKCRQDNKRCTQGLKLKSTGLVVN